MAVRKRRLREGHVRALQRHASDRQVPLARRARAGLHLLRVPLRTARPLWGLHYGVRPEDDGPRARAGVGKCGRGRVRWPGASRVRACFYRVLERPSDSVVADI